MSKDKLNDRVNELFERGRWEQARKLLERERRKDPTSHWVLTQLGVTYYEQRQYKQARRYFVASRSIVPDCPLTLWNYAGTLDALGSHREAVRILLSLLKSKTSAVDDPCWESPRWTDSLKADCVYRLGVCFQNLGKKKKAEQCYREYVNLLLTGIEGSYSLEDVKRDLRSLIANGRHNGAKVELRKALKTALSGS